MENMGLSKETSQELAELFYHSVNDMAISMRIKVEKETYDVWLKFLLRDLALKNFDLDFQDFINAMIAIGKEPMNSRFGFGYGDIYQKAKEIRQRRPDRLTQQKFKAREEQCKLS